MHTAPHVLKHMHARAHKHTSLVYMLAQLSLTSYLLLLFSLSPSLSLCFSLYFSLSLSFSLVPLTCALSFSLLLSLSLSFLVHTHTLSLSISLPLTHTLSLSLSHTHTLSLSHCCVDVFHNISLALSVCHIFSLSLTHTHTHRHSMWPTFSSASCAIELRLAFYYLLQDVCDQKASWAIEILNELKSILVLGLGLCMRV